MVSHLFSWIACNNEGWFKLAYISTEISYAVNSVIMIIFWGILWPMMIAGMEGQSSPEITFLKWYQGLLHAIPWVCTVTDLWMTDMALEKSHWWITYITMSPCYMICNWIGAMTLGNMSTREKGTIYGVETWATNPALSIFYFQLLAIFQSALFYCSALVIDKCWPKRPEEEYELDKEIKSAATNLLDTGLETAKNQIN